MTSRKLWLLILVLTGVHLALAAALPLVEDEAYYSLWASVPSAGYYDHPPVVAWAIAAGQGLLGQTALGVRLFSVLATSLVVVLTYRIGWLVGGRRSIGLRAALFLTATIPVAAFGFAATPDPASVLFWTAATWALAEVLTGKAPLWWLLVGLFAGLGVLSKFTNLFFGLALVLWLIGTREGRGWLGRWQVWAGAAIGIAVLGPFLAWNAAHDWIGLERQFGRVGEAGQFSPMRETAFWVSFMLLLTPLVFWLDLRAMRVRRAAGILWWLVSPVIAYLAYHALWASSGGQWLVPIFPTLAVIAAINTPKGAISNWAAPVGLGLSALVLVIGFWPGRVIIPGQNAFNQGRGWGEVRREIQAAMAQEDAVWIATDAYGLTGQLWHYFGQDVPVWSVTGKKRYLFRGDFPAALCKAKGIFLSRRIFAGPIPYFAKSTHLKDIVRREGRRDLARYGVAIVEGVLPSGAAGCGR